LLSIPDLVRFACDALAVGAKLRGSRMIPAALALRGPLALKLWAIEPKSHVMALMTDEGLALFCGLAQDADAQVFCYANADIRKGGEAKAIFRFIDFWTTRHGGPPRHQVFDSKPTTYHGLDRLDQAGITFDPTPPLAKTPDRGRRVAAVGVAHHHASMCPTASTASRDFLRFARRRSAWAVQSRAELPPRGGNNGSAGRGKVVSAAPNWV